ncbi:Trypsin-co-occurring domain-containing protein [Tumidithrix helvetica PCC 7403]|uniref:CU044_2847 family protein n=1 Tax=Tumidithrix helvetica TaxID=3457545 RepID=UPI003C87FDC3
MEFEQARTEILPVQLEGGSIIRVEVAKTGREDVSFDLKPFKQVTDALEGIVQAVAIPIQRAKPQKATVKFGIEIAVESGQLTAILVKGTGKANLEITLEWQSPHKGS